MAGSARASLHARAPITSIESTTLGAARLVMVTSGTESRSGGIPPTTTEQCHHLSGILLPREAGANLVRMNKQDLVEQLARQLAVSARAALASRDAAAAEARDGATPDEKH